MNRLARCASVLLAALLFTGLTACSSESGDTALNEISPSPSTDEPVVTDPIPDDPEPVVPDPIPDPDPIPAPPLPVIQPISGLSFSPFVGTQDPNLGACVSTEQLHERLEILQGYTERIRTFGTNCGLEQAPGIAQELGFTVSAGAWLDKDTSTNEAEIEQLIRIGLAGHADVLIVGSETLYRGDLTEQALIDYIERVREAVPGVMVTTAETYQVWIDHPDLVNAVDVLYANYYPYWEGISIERAIAALHVSHQRVVAIAGGKEVVVSETGWPSCGDTQGDAVPTPENAARYFMEFVTWAEANGVAFLYFEAFDEPWKAKYEGPQGACWGIFTTDGELKPGMLAVFEGERSVDTWSVVDDIVCEPTDPGLFFTFVPEISTTDDLQGRACHVEPTEHGVVVYILVSNRWWVKPYATSPISDLRFDGYFTTDITTGGADVYATAITALLIPRSYSPPIALGWLTLPAELYENAIAFAEVTR